MHERSDRDDFGDIGGARGRSVRARSISPTLVGLIVIGAVALIFVLQNSRKTTVRFLFFDPTTRVWTAILVAMALGVVLDRLFLAWWRRRRREDV
jgi:uncharacterized integral membrane protein